MGTKETSLVRGFISVFIVLTAAAFSTCTEAQEASLWGAFNWDRAEFASPVFTTYMDCEAWTKTRQVGVRDQLVCITR